MASGRSGRDRRRRAHLERLAQSSGVTGDERRGRARDGAARQAAAAPSAARWLVPVNGDADASTGAAVVALDVVREIVVLDPAARAGSRDDRRRTEVARQVEPLVTAGAQTLSGRTLLEVLVPDPADRTTFEPAFDLDALLNDRPVRDGGVDRALRLSTLLRVIATRHADGAVDLHARVAPDGIGRHPAADAVDALCAVALGEGTPDRLPLDPSVDPAATVAPGGWLGRGALELFLLAASGIAQGDEATTVGAALAGVFQRWVDGADLAWHAAITRRAPVDAADLLHEASTRAGSDHPSVLGGELARLVALRHPLAR